MLVRALLALDRHAGVVGPHVALDRGIAAVGREQRTEHRRVGQHQHPARVEQDGVDLAAHGDSAGGGALQARPARRGMTNLMRHLAAGLVDHLVAEHDRALALVLGRLPVGVEDAPRPVELLLRRARTPRSGS